MRLTRSELTTFKAYGIKIGPMPAGGGGSKEQGGEEPAKAGGCC